MFFPLPLFVSISLSFFPFPFFFPFFSFCWCLQYTQPLTSHSPPFSSMLTTTTTTTTTTKSWRSDTLIVLPGWECHTGGSRSKPTVHRCSQRGRRLWVARQVHKHEPNGSATIQQETVHQCQHVQSFFHFLVHPTSPFFSPFPGAGKEGFKGFFKQLSFQWFQFPFLKPSSHLF